jgi:6-phosphogluconolactonase/glucosamine-6-phosphate isomerase/deaminase
MAGARSPEWAAPRRAAIIGAIRSGAPQVDFEAPPTADRIVPPEAFLAAFAAWGRAAFGRSGRFTVAVSPAAMTAPLVDAFAVGPIADERFWRGTHLFLADSDAGSDPRELRAVARRLPVPASGLHLDVAEGPNPLKAAAYEQELRAFFALQGGLLPRFDLVVLALRADGRLGGLLPGGRALDEIERLVRADFDLQRGQYVATLTPPVIRNAAAIVVAAPRNARDAVASQIVAGAREAARLPLAALRAAVARVSVVAALPAIDSAAAPSGS